MPLLLKLETKSRPVRGISFHHKKPWVLASLENGIIQHWDLQIFELRGQYRAHDGAVRGICFHITDSIFVSGGDDNILKVWNVEDKTCISVLSGHFDIITSCSFHHKFPWVISSSNDRTIRIWNWNMNLCIAKLVGHEMAVTCAKLHPTSNIVCSSSADGTIRLWDISELEKKLVKRGTRANQIEPTYIYKNHGLDPNSKGLNSIAFNFDGSFVAAGSNDKQLIVYRCSKGEAKKLTDLRNYEGHDNIVNSVAFHPYLHMIIECSNDKSIRIWFVATRECIDTLRYKNERFGVLASHPSLCLFAAGHENGMILFKNRREKPVFCLKDGFVYYLKNLNSELRKLDLKTDKDVSIQKVEPDYYSEGRRSISFNSDEEYFIEIRRTQDRNRCYYELHKVQSESDVKLNSHGKYLGMEAFWITRKQYVVLNAARKIKLFDLSNSYICELDVVADNIFYAGTGMILLKTEGEYRLFDVEQKTVTASVKLYDEVRYVIWNESKGYAAFMFKKKVYLLNRKLDILCIQQESSNVKSGCWIDESVFVYNTRYQVKYASTSGDTGIIKTLDKQLYIFAFRGSSLCCFDRLSNVVDVPIKLSFFKMKSAMFHRRFHELVQLLKAELDTFICRSVIESLVNYGYSDLALACVYEKKRFKLELELGQLEKCLESAEQINSSDVWETLAEHALLQGNHKIAEICYQKTSNYEKLTFLYLVTGNTEKLKELMSVIDDLNTLFQLSLLIGDIGKRIQILKRCGQTSLAYLAAATHGYDDEVNELKQELESKKIPFPTIDSSSIFLAPPRPIHQLLENWPVNCAPNLEETKLCSSKICEVTTLKRRWKNN